MPSTHSRLARVLDRLGWAGSRRDWLNRVGLVLWVMGLVYIIRQTSWMSTGEAILAILAWGFVLGIAARDAIRDMFGPVFFYEMMRIGRRKLTFRLRFVYVVAIAALLVLMYVSWLESLDYFRNPQKLELISTQRMSRFAHEFFEIFVVMQYLTVMLLTPVYVAGSIAVEKERKTLEFLLATDLRNREIIFGKLAARVTNLVMFVFAGLPVVAFLQLFGGIDPNLLLAAFAATVINIIGLSAVSVYLSVMLRRARDAILLTYMLALVYVFVSIVMAVMSLSPMWTGAWWTSPVTVLGYSVALSDLFLAVAYGNPVIVVMRLQGPAALSTGVTDLFREFALFWGFVTVVCLGLAVLRLRVVALRQSYGPVAQPKPRRDGTPAPSKHPPIGDNPIFWREVFVEGGVRGGCLGKIISFIIVVLMFVPVVMITYEYYGPDRFNWRSNWSSSEIWHEFSRSISGWVQGTTGVISTLLFFAVATRGAGAITGEKDKDTWISLLSVPMSSDRILLGKWWGCVLGPRKAYTVMILIWSIGLAVGAVHPGTLIIAIPVQMLLMSAFAWIGLYCSMLCKTSMQSSIVVFFITCFFAGGFWALVGICCALPLNLMGADGRFMDDVAQVGLGMTPPFMAGVPLFFDFEERDMRPFDFEASHGLGFCSLLIGMLVWLGILLLAKRLSMAKFRRMTNQDKKVLPEQALLEQVRAEKAASPPLGG